MVKFVQERKAATDDVRISVRSIDLRAQSADDEEMTIEAVLSTETPVRMVDRREWEMMNEILLASGRQKVDYLPMLDSHNRYSIEDVLGHMDNIRTEGTDTVVTCRFDKDDEGAVKAFRKYRNGHARGLSVGYSVMRYIDIAPGQSAVVAGRTFTAGKDHKTRVVTQWRPDEGSLVAIGADRKALTRAESGARGLSWQITDEEFEQINATRSGERSGSIQDSVETVVDTSAEPDGDQSQIVAVEPVKRLEASFGSTHPSVVINVHNGERSPEGKPAPEVPEVHHVDTERQEADQDGAALVPVVTEVPAGNGGEERKANEMAEHVADTSAAETDKVAPVDAEKIRREAVQEGVRLETARRNAIQELAKTDVSAECLQRCLADPEISIDKARDAFLEDIRKSRTPSSEAVGSEIPDGNEPHFNIGRSRSAPTVEILTAAMALRMGGDKAAKNLMFVKFDPVLGRLRMTRSSRVITEEDRKQHERNINDAYRYDQRASAEFCEYALRAQKIECPEFIEDIVTRALSTPAITTIYTQTMGAVLLSNLGDMKDSTMSWCKEDDVPNFKPKELHRLEGGALTKRIRGKNADSASFADTMEQFQIAEYANVLVIDSQDLIDDSLGAWQTTMSEYSRGIADLRPSLVYGFLAANAALRTDNVALFHAASHGNLQTTSGLASGTLETAITLLAKQRGTNGLNLNLREHVLVTSVAKSFLASTLTRSAERRDTTATTIYGTKNPLEERNILTENDSRLDTGFTNPDTGVAVAAAPGTWYLAAKGGDYGLHVGYLAGTNRMPTMSVKPRTGDGAYGLAMDVQCQIGVGVEAYQGLVASTA